MPGGRPRVNLTPYREELKNLYSEGLTLEQLVHYLHEEHTIQVNLRTIKRRFREWGFRRPEPVQLSEDLQRRIQVLFFDEGLQDKDMLMCLNREGFQIGKFTLVRLRFALGLRRRISRLEEAQRSTNSNSLTLGVDSVPTTNLCPQYPQNDHQPISPYASDLSQRQDSALATEDFHSTMFPNNENYPKSFHSSVTPRTESAPVRSSAPCVDPSHASPELNTPMSDTGDSPFQPRDSASLSLARYINGNAAGVLGQPINEEDDFEVTNRQNLDHNRLPAFQYYAARIQLKERDNEIGRLRAERDELRAERDKFLDERDGLLSDNLRLMEENNQKEGEKALLAGQVRQNEEEISRLINELKQKKVEITHQADEVKRTRSSGKGRRIRV